MMLFIAIGILPLLLLGLMLGVDFMRYYSSMNYVQEQLDNAVLHAYRFLPHKNRAEAVVRSYLSVRNKKIFGETGEKVQVQINNDQIRVLFEGQHPVAFLDLPTRIWFSSKTRPDGKTAAVAKGTLPVARSSRAGGSPFHVLLAIDANPYMAPGLMDQPDPNDSLLAATAASAWGGESEWPKSSWFPDSWKVDARIATQQCFNPSFSALKKGAWDAYQYFRGYDRDRVGVAVFPGGATDLAVLRRTCERGAPGAAPSGPYHDGSILGNASAEASFVSFDTAYTADSLCMGLALEAGKIGGKEGARYALPPSRADLPGWENGAGVPPQFALHPTLSGDGLPVFSDLYRPNVSLNEAVWSLTARFAEVGFDRTFPQMVREALLGKCNEQANTNLGNLSKKVLIIFSGDLPRINGLAWNSSDPADPVSEGVSTALADARHLIFNTLDRYNFYLQVFYVVLDGPHLGGVDKAALSDEFNTYVQSRMFEAHSGSDVFGPAQNVPGIADDDAGRLLRERFRFEVFYAQDDEALLAHVVPLLVVGDRNATVLK